MLREERLEAFAAANPVQLIELADRVLVDVRVEVTRGPLVGALMVRLKEPAERLVFNFTEMTVTEAEVASGETRGYAMVPGRQPEVALAGAVLDLALEMQHPSSAAITALLEAASRACEQAWLQRWADVEPTSVRFEESTY